jgi:hypothetical protein
VMVMASRAQTEDPPPSHRTGLRHPSRERNFSMQRRRVGQKRSVTPSSKSISPASVLHWQRFRRPIGARVKLTVPL